MPRWCSTVESFRGPNPMRTSIRLIYVRHVLIKATVGELRNLAINAMAAGADVIAHFLTATTGAIRGASKNKSRSL